MQDDGNDSDEGNQEEQVENESEVLPTEKVASNGCGQYTDEDDVPSFSKASEKKRRERRKLVNIIEIEDSDDGQ